MTPERIDDFVERIDDDPRPRTIREVITTAVREAFEEAAKVADSEDEAWTITVGGAIRALAKEVGK